MNVVMNCLKLYRNALLYFCDEKSNKEKYSSKLIKLFPIEVYNYKSEGWFVWIIVFSSQNIGQFDSSAFLKYYSDIVKNQ